MPLTFSIVSQETFLHELGRAEKYFSEAGKFVGLSHFIKGHLGPMGFDYRASIRTAAWLDSIGKIEFYKVRPPVYDVEITAVRLRAFSKASLQYSPFQLHKNFYGLSKMNLIEDGYSRKHNAGVETNLLGILNQNILQAAV